MSSKKNTSKKGSTPKNEGSLERKPEHGMNPTAILAGYGPRGERIRHTVHSGALTLPKDALDVLDAVVEETGLVPPETFKLPGLDTVVRPTMDPRLKSVIVTHIRLERVLVPDLSYIPMPVPTGYPQPQQQMVDVIRTTIENHTIKRARDSVAPVDRIRGGGDDDFMDVDHDPAPADAPEGQAAPAPPVAPASLTPALPLDVNPPASSVTSSAPSSQDATPSAPTQASTPASPPVGPASSTEPKTCSDPTTAVFSPLAISVQSTDPSGPPTHTTALPGQTTAAAPVAESTPSPATEVPTTVAPVPTSAPSSSTPATETVVSKSPAPAQSSLSSSTPATETVVNKSPAPAPSAPSSSTPATETVVSKSPAPAQTKLQILDSKPEPRWEQHRPGPNDEMVAPDDQLTPKPSWYTKDGVAELERIMLPEWFDHSAKHRTPESYIKARETIVEMSATLANRNVTNAMVRRSVVGDAGSLLRLRNFLTHWGLINEDATNDSAPTPATLRDKYPVPKQFNDRQRDNLVTAVVEQTTKRRKLDADGSFLPINWEEIALQVGDGATSDDCERNFLSIPLHQEDAERPITPETSSVASLPTPTSKDVMRHEFIRELVDSCRPEVVRRATVAALEAAEPKEAQSGAILGLVSCKAVETARQAENQIESVLSQLLDQRMKKLENRMAMMDDVESILEAEKMALELERRDLYTARCRHWFGGA